MLRGVRPAGWLALGRQSWRSLTRADTAIALKAAAAASEAPPRPSLPAWDSGASLSTSRLLGQSTLSQQTAALSQFHGADAPRQPPDLILREVHIEETPLLERETIAYMRSVRTGTEVYLIGTAHVSKASAEEVKEVMEKVRPQYVGVELDEERAKHLLSGDMHGDTESRGLLGILRELLHAPGDLGQKILTVAMRSMYKMLRATGLVPGLEFKVAIEEAHKMGAEVVMLDRPADETMARLRQVLSLWDILTLFTKKVDPKDIPPVMKDMGRVTPENVEQKTEQLKNREAVHQITQFMEKRIPQVVRVMVHERDEIIFNRLRQLRGCVVAVVGMAHMDGIERLWKEEEDLGVEQVKDI